MQKYKAAETTSSIHVNTQRTGTNSRTKDRVDKHAVCIAGAKFFSPQFHYRPRLFEQVNDTQNLQWVRNELRSIQPVSKTRETLLTLVAQSTRWGTTQWHLYSLPLKIDLQVRQQQETIVAEKNSTTLLACGWLNHVYEGAVGFLGLG